MIETILVVIGWVAVATWIISSLWQVCVDGHRRGSNPRPPGGAPPPPPGPPPPLLSSRRSAWLKSIDNHGNMCPQPTGGRLIALDRDPERPSLGLSMDREVASRLDDLERRVALLERLTRTLSAELNRLRHG